MSRYEEESCAVRFEEGPDDDCRHAVDCCAIPYESFAYHYVNTVDHICDPGHHRTAHNHRLLCIVHVGIGHGSHPISFGFRCGSGRRLGGSHRHDADDPMIVVTRYPDSGRIDARPDVRIYFEA